MGPGSRNPVRWRIQGAQPTMKLAAAFLVLCAALLCQCTAAFFMRSLPKPEVPVVSALAPPALPVDAKSLAGGVAGAVAQLPVPGFNPLSFLLTSLGIPVKHLVEGSRKCVTELGPEAVGAVKSLLGALTFFG